ncbi:MAG: hypothetical protein ACRD2O_16535 [Terriglobia bacterium]
MKNAHERFGTLEFTKRMKDTTTHVRLRLDRFIGETEEKQNSRFHLISVPDGDSDINAVMAAIHEQASSLGRVQEATGWPQPCVKARSDSEVAEGAAV